jgi:hypothetical protein
MRQPLSNITKNSIEKQTNNFVSQVIGPQMQDRRSIERTKFSESAKLGGDGSNHFIPNFKGFVRGAAGVNTVEEEAQPHYLPVQL